MIKNLLTNCPARLLNGTRHLLRSEGGNVLMMMGFAIIPLTLAIGFGVDYSRAERLQTQLNAIADGAALAAVDPQLLCQSSAASNAAATAMFNSQANILQGVGSLTPTITIMAMEHRVATLPAIRSIRRFGIMAVSSRMPATTPSTPRPLIHPR